MFNANLKILVLLMLSVILMLMRLKMLMLVMLLLMMQMQVTSVCTGFPAKQKRFLREPVEASGGNSLKYNFLTKLFF